MHLNKSLTIFQGSAWPSKSIGTVLHHILGHIWNVKKMITNFKSVYALLNYMLQTVNPKAFSFVHNSNQKLFQKIYNIILKHARMWSYYV